MERNEQSEHLQVIEQPIVPQKPIKPNRPKLFAVSFALAMAAGFGGRVLGGDVGSNHSRHPRARRCRRQSFTGGHTLHRRQPAKFDAQNQNDLCCGRLSPSFLLLGIATALYIGVEVDFSWFDRSWIDNLTRLSK